MLLLQRKMGPENGRGVRKIKLLIDTPTEFELGDTAADIQRRRGEAGKREGRRETETEGGSQEGGYYTLRKGGSGQKACKDRQK